MLVFDWKREIYGNYFIDFFERKIFIFTRYIRKLCKSKNIIDEEICYFTKYNFNVFYRTLSISTKLQESVTEMHNVYMINIYIYNLWDQLIQIGD